MLEGQLGAIVGAAHVRPGQTRDSIAGAPPRLIVEPANEREVSEVLRFANDAGLAVIPRCGGTKLEWGNSPSRADLILSMVRLNQVVEHAWADLTVTVQAGCTVSSVQQALAQCGQRLAVDALWPDKASIGGILSSNDSGALRLRYGGLRDLIIGVTLALPDGTLASSGGKVVKNVAGYDLPKLATGALGTLGVITRAVFRLHPLPQNTRTLSNHPGSVAEMQRLMFAIQDSILAHASLQVRLPSNEVDILFEGTSAGIAAQEGVLRKLAGAARVSAPPGDVWSSRQALWDEAETGAVIAKLSILPSAIEHLAQILAKINAATWQAVVQATGIGYLRLNAPVEDYSSILNQLRSELERDGGSFVILRQPPEAGLEAWGNPGDALPLMRRLKQQFDPRSTLNPGRFVGGI